MTNFNKIAKKEEEKKEAEYKERLDKCVPIAKKVLKIIIDSDPYLGDLQDKKGNDIEEAKKKYESIAEKALILFLEEDINWVDRNFIFQLALQAVEQSQEKTINSLNRSYDRVMEMLLGKDILDLKMKDLDKIIKEKVKKD